MNIDKIYEKWRAERAQVQPAPDFADRVMRVIANAPADSPMPAFPSRWNNLVRVGLCAAAGIAALARAVELLSVFSATAIGN